MRNAKQVGSVTGTALLFAAASGYIRLASCLIENRADIEKRDVSFQFAVKLITLIPNN